MKESRNKSSQGVHKYELVNVNEGETECPMCGYTSYMIPALNPTNDVPSNKFNCPNCGDWESNTNNNPKTYHGG